MLPGKNYFCILNVSGILSFVEAKTGAIYKMIRTNLPSTIDFDFSKDGKEILLTTEKGSCSLRKLPEDSSIIVIRPDGKIEKTPDFYFAFARPSSSGALQLNAFLSKFSNDDNSSSKQQIAHSPGNRIIATTHDGALRIWSKDYGSLLATIAEKLASEFLSCRFSVNGKNLIGKLKSGHYIVYQTEDLDTDQKNYLNAVKKLF